MLKMYIFTNEEFLNFLIPNSREKGSYWLKWIRLLLVAWSTVDWGWDHELRRYGEHTPHLPVEYQLIPIGL